MNKPLLSFCIPVYNQVDIVERLVRQILYYKGEDIEVVISDDCSTENIHAMLENIGDKRIIYFRNNTNLGHDLNIINSFRMAKGKYGFLLRARDGVVVRNIKRIVDVINTGEPISYITGGAVDEDNRSRIKYSETRLVKDKRDCLRLHYSLYVHPSGSVYNIQMLNLDRIEQFIKKNIDSKYSFVVHSLFRMSLSKYGYFYILNVPTWVYVDTSKVKDIAVNKAPNGISVYSSELILKRYVCELKWVFENINEDRYGFQYAVENLFKNYIYQITWGQKRRNSNKGLINHYQINPVKSGIKTDTENMLKSAHNVMIEYGRQKDEIADIDGCLRKNALKNSIIGGIRYIGACLLDFVHLKWIYDHWRKNHEIKY